jgi:hypothetical protein
MLDPVFEGLTSHYAPREHLGSPRTSLSTPPAVRRSFRRTMAHLDAVLVRSRGLTFLREPTLDRPIQSIVVEVENNSATGYGYFLESVKVDDVQVVPDGGVRLGNVGQVNYLVPVERRGPKNGPVQIVVSGWPLPLDGRGQIQDVPPPTAPIVVSYSHGDLVRHHQRSSSQPSIWDGDGDDRRRLRDSVRVGSTAPPYSSSHGGLPSASADSSLSTLISLRRSLPPIALPPLAEAIAGSKRHTLSALSARSPLHRSPSSYQQQLPNVRQSMPPSSDVTPPSQSQSVRQSVVSVTPSSSSQNVQVAPPLASPPAVSTPAKRHFSTPLAAFASSLSANRRPSLLSSSSSLSRIAQAAAPSSPSANLNDAESSGGISSPLPPPPPSKSELEAREVTDHYDDDGREGFNRGKISSMSFGAADVGGGDGRGGREGGGGVIKGSGGDALISLSLVPLRGPTIAALDVFLVDIFVLNRSRFSRLFSVRLPLSKSASTANGTKTPATAKGHSTSTSSHSVSAAFGKGERATMPGLLALENDFRIG